MGILALSRVEGETERFFGELRGFFFEILTP